VRELGGSLPVGRAAPQVVQVRDGDLRQTSVLPLAEYLPFALQDAACGRPAQSLMRPVGRDQ
jgi:hypothetical protein